MWYVVASLLGMVGGGLAVFFALEKHRRELRDVAAEAAACMKQVACERQENLATSRDLAQQREHFLAEQAEFGKKVIAYQDLQAENAVLKRDLLNLDIATRKLQIDGQRQQENQQLLDQRVDELGRRYLQENVDWLGDSLTQHNFVACKQKLQKVIAECREIGLVITKEDEAHFLTGLRQKYEKVVRAAFEREAQARIKAQIREEQLREKEIERELKQLEREKEAIHAALSKALAQAKDEHSAEVERLRARLAEAEEKSQRAVSQAQLTKSGYVYVISNIGSFGEGVFKIGMTRRLEPLERVKELGDASVPFPFDVHMMIASDDAPSLENALHRALHKTRLNKINPRKEFFRSDIDAIRQIVQAHHGEVLYVADPEALQYRQSLSMTEEDMEYIETVYDKLEEEEDRKEGTPDD